MFKVQLEPLLKRFYLNDFVFAEEEAAHGTRIRHARVMIRAQKVEIASPLTDPFVPMGKLYRDGSFYRSNVIVCEVPGARVHVPTGLVCTHDYLAIADTGMGHRLWAFGPFKRGRKPFFIKKLRGTYSTINYCMAGNFWHWMIDCLPKIHLLAQAEPKAKITLLMPAIATEFQRETIRCVLPDHFEVSYIIGDEWVQAENFLWPSLVSDRCMGLLPPEYYEAIRRPIFEKMGLPPSQPRTERIYVSRRHAKHRRVLNEDELMVLLTKYGVRRVDLEGMTFRRQIELFQCADLVIGPHGAGLGTIFFSGPLSLVALYPTQVPPNYFHTLAIGLGQKHHLFCHHEVEEDANFDVDLVALENVLKNELHLQPSS